MFKITQKGDFKNTERFLSKAKKLNLQSVLSKYGGQGVAALSAATPMNTGKTASSWDYKVEIQSGRYTLSWFNTNENDGMVIAILIQYGHGTGNGGYVQGYDYINPAMRPIFDQIAENLWKEVTSL